ncbi:H(+)/Cl(-) exchange transporter ClcA [Aestuariivirga litoralis]|uniref:H(+)/Cl(-) exchange transporter ClcA n=1 Tax=Aestuariivirga litoralis TaxID=2650924 RepID=A0A2W2AID0_9HYPH|nr:H(+)/Cl(-) exchange transporter ClcA [Aestuariivirga litoralis]PZF75215.1 H(+)/Cl(-) exchange transporter ClcA [Aestuariivirga litoralis]
MRDGGLIMLAGLTLLAGALTGLVATLFRVLLEQAEQLRVVLIGHAQAMGAAGFGLVVVVPAVMALLAAWLVRRFQPHATGSGIPHVEAVLHGKISPSGSGLAVVKFIGGLLAIGGGLVLGREGPSVQMGAAISFDIGRLFRRKWADCRVLLAAGAGAGLATAFNAPIAGAVFVLEELVQRFEHRIAIAALGAAASAVTVGHLLTGNAPDFQVMHFAEPGVESWPLFMILGGVAGALAVAYNRSILGALALADRARRLPVEGRAALVGAVIGAVAWFAPGLVGGGDPITQSILSGGAVLAVMPAVFALRFLLGAASYAAGTPGGLFAPLLVLGAQIGFLFGAACGAIPFISLPPEGFAVIGMAAFFAGVVRAPLTGIVLVGEMTGSSSLLLPAVFASFTAMMVAELLRERPIYDALRDRTIRLDARLRNNDAVQHFLR